MSEIKSKIPGYTAKEANEALETAAKVSVVQKETGVQVDSSKIQYKSFEEFAKEQMNKQFGMGGLEARLIVSMSASFNEEEACLMVASEICGNLTVRNTFYGREATDMYFKLIGHEA